MKLSICTLIVYEDNLATDTLNKLLDCENDVRKLLAGNNEQIVLESKRNTVHLSHVIYNK